MFQSKNKKIVYPCKPQFYYTKLWCKGVLITRTCYPYDNGTILTFSFVYFLLFPVDLTGQLHSLKDGDRKKNKEEINVTTPDPLDKTIEETPDSHDRTIEMNFLTNRLDPPTYEEATSTASAAWNPISFNTNL